MQRPTNFTYFSQSVSQSTHLARKVAPRLRLSELKDGESTPNLLQETPKGQSHVDFDCQVSYYPPVTSQVQRNKALNATCVLEHSSTTGPGQHVRHRSVLPAGSRIKISSPDPRYSYTFRKSSVRLTVSYRSGFSKARSDSASQPLL